MIGRLKFLGLLVANALLALIGTAIVESSLYRALPSPHTMAAVLVKETILSFLISALIGFGIWRAWHGESTKWTWVLTTIWFVFGAVVIARRGGVFGSVLPSGTPDAREVRSFFSFTIVCVRGAGYSLGAYVSSLMFTPIVDRSSEQ